MPGVLRAFEGLSPTVVVVGARLTIGRASDADLQLLDPHVSRRHARIERDQFGAAVLVDLASATGTRIGTARIDRHVLQDGDLIRIADVTLRYEQTDEAPRQQRAPVERGIRSLRPTLRLDPIRRELGPSIAASRDIVREGHLGVPDVVIAPPEAFLSPAAAIVSVQAAIAPTSVASARVRSEARARDARRWTPCAVDPSATHKTTTGQYVPASDNDTALVESLFVDDDGEPPVGECGRELVRDVFDYRTLRMRAVRGETLPAASVERLRELDERMHRHCATQRALEHLRRYHRFACDVPGWIGSLSGRSVSTLAIELKDVGAGGAQVTGTDRRFQAGDPCWLVVDLETEDQSPLVVFRARVAWNDVDAARMGIAFSGAAKSGLDVVEMIRTDA